MWNSVNANGASACQASCNTASHPRHWQVRGELFLYTTAVTEDFYYVCLCTERKMNLPAPLLGSSAYPSNLKYRFWSWTLFFSLNQELNEQEAEACQFVLMRRLWYNVLTPRLQRVDHYEGFRAELSPDAATGLPGMEHTFTEVERSHYAGSRCGFRKSSSSLEQTSARSPPTSLTFD